MKAAEGGIRALFLRVGLRTTHVRIRERDLVENADAEARALLNQNLSRGMVR